MANEGRKTGSLQIIFPSGRVKYTPRPTSFNFDVGTDGGPYVGGVTVTTDGVNIDLSAIDALGGWCRIYNQDTVSNSTNFLEIGIWDPDNSKFFPLHELLQGEFYEARLARNLSEEYGTGTGTTGPDANQLRLKAWNAPIEVLIEAFNK